MIETFLQDVDWGELDYLIVDTPPGTSDEHLSTVNLLSSANVSGVVIITTPQVALSITFINRVLLLVQVQVIVERLLQNDVLCVDCGVKYYSPVVH